MERLQSSSPRDCLALVRTSFADVDLGCLPVECGGCVVRSGVSFSQVGFGGVGHRY